MRIIVITFCVLAACSIIVALIGHDYLTHNGRCESSTRSIIYTLVNDIETKRGHNPLGSFPGSNAPAEYIQSLVTNNVDGWGRYLHCDRYRHHSNSPVVEIRSCGQDGVIGTSDDITTLLSVWPEPPSIPMHGKPHR